jgi:hypothetical protein
LGGEVFLLIQVLFSFVAAHATPVADFPSYVPLDSIRPPATDLYYQNRILFPNEARDMQAKGTDISQIDPDPTTDLWSPTTTVTATADKINVLDGDHSRFVELVDTPVKIFRFNILHHESDGTDRLYTVLVGKRIHTFLLRKALLEKLGYHIPPMKRMANLIVEFGSSMEKDRFIEDKAVGLRWQADGAEQWISNLADKNSKELDFHDVVVLNGNDPITNLALGYIRPDITRGRRLINSLIVPFNLIDVRESINGFRWNAVTIRNNAIYFPLEDMEEFATPIEDARWIARRLQKLTRQDYVDVVNSVGYPDAPAKLLVEKLIARRNNVIKALNISDAPLMYNPDITVGEELVKGELLKGDYDGFGARLAMGEEESPVSPKEIWALFKSKGISTIIEELIARANKEIPRPDLQAITIDHMKKDFINDLVDAIKSGKPIQRDFGIWSTPLYGGNLIASREVVSGSYLGTDNRIQLVDTLGFNVTTGMYFGTLGFKVGQSLDAQASVYYSRTYSHIRPLNSIEASLHEPYKNILVPLVKHDMAKVIPGDLSETFDKLSPEDQVKKAQEIAQLFKDNLGDGESIIITDSIGNLDGIRYGYSFTDKLKAQAQLKGSLVHIARLHILRVGDTLHVYKDRGNLASLELSVTLKAQVELLNVRGQLTKGVANSDFYKLDISNDFNQNPDLITNLTAIRQVLMDSKITRLKNIKKPVTLSHSFNEKQGEINFLVWNHLSLSATDRVSVLRPEETEKDDYVRYYNGERSGVDYQSMSVDILNYLLQKATGEQTFAISNTLSGDPGDTIYGKSNSRYSYFEGELDKSSKVEKFGEQFVGVIYRWRGWSAKNDEVRKKVKEFSDRYQFQFYDENAFNLVKKAELYTLALRIYVYQPGINYILSQSQRQIEAIFDQYSKLPKQGEPGGPIIVGTETSPLDRATESYYYYRKDYDQAVAKGDTSKAAQNLTSLISLLEASLNKEGLLTVVGGNKNVLITSDIQGFLKGEDGSYAKLPIEGNQIGQVASKNPSGPLSAVQSDIGMTESEFFINWLLRKI